MQQSILRWVLAEDGKSLESPRTYFYLDWDGKNSDIPSHHAVWYHVMPKDKKIRWRRVFRWDNKEAILCCSHPPPKITDEPYWGSVYDSFLKSHLQKSIRRKNARSSVYTADLLLELSPLQFVRRLPVIMIEDGVVHESFSTLVWLMCAVCSKKSEEMFLLHKRQKQWLLGVVYVMATSTFKEEIRRNKYWNPKEKENFYYDLKRIHSLSTEKVSLLYSMELRRVYGGLKGDSKMFTAFLKSYLDRFSKHKKMPKEWIIEYTRPVRPILLKRTPFKQKEWVLPAYDFHCAPSLITLLNEEYPDYDKDDIKSSIWWKSSSINSRPSLEYSLKNNQFHAAQPYMIPKSISLIWVSIRRRVGRKAWGYVQRMLEDLHLMYPDWVDYTPPPQRDESSSETKTKESEKDEEPVETWEKICLEQEVPFEKLGEFCSEGERCWYWENPDQIPEFGAYYRTGNGKVLCDVDYESTRVC